MDIMTATDVTQPTQDPNVEGAAPQDIDPSRKALLDFWYEEIKNTRDDKKTVEAFKRMRDGMKIVARGSSDEDWIKSDNYVMPILNRHVNLAVSTLYARNPQVLVKRKERILFKIWDGNSQTASSAFQAFQAGDPSQLPVLQDIATGQQYMQLLDKIAKTLRICWQHFMNEQEFNYKLQLKSAVRRAKTNGVAYAVIDYQRVMEPRPDLQASILDMTSKIAEIEHAMQDQQEGDDFDEEKLEAEQLRLNLQDIQNNPDMVTTEGPVLSFPRSTSIFVDRKCTDLRTLAGARWVAHEIPMTEEDIETIYGVDFDEDGGATEYKDETVKKAKDARQFRVYRVWDRKNQQEFTICDGYKDFLKEPSTPPLKMNRFFPVFPLVFNATESEEYMYPPSDVWLARHPQDELNRARQGIREHRKANKPFYAVAKGALEEDDKNKLANHAAHEVIEFGAMGPGDDITKKMQRPALNPIDPAQYDTKGHIEDVMRSVGTQQANLGPTSGATATESSIAENSRQASQSDNIDDLDEWLTEIAKAGGQLLLSELPKDKALEIAGPGAAWPDMPETRVQVAMDIELEIEAGSSGRPNRAAELADMERAAPYLQNLPGVNPAPFVKKYLQLLNIDLEEGMAEGMPSIQAINAAMSAQARGAMPMGAPPPAGASPNAQGAAGAHNAPTPQQPVGSQPAHPPPGAGNVPMANHS